MIKELQLIAAKLWSNPLQSVAAVASIDFKEFRAGKSPGETVSFSFQFNFIMLLPAASSTEH